MKKVLLTTVLAMSFAAPHAFADEHMDGKHEGGKHHKGKMFEEADKNNDGALSLTEFKAHQDKKAEEWFKKLDTDGNGSVTQEEAKAGHEKMRERVKERMEKRKDAK